MDKNIVYFFVGLMIPILIISLMIFSGNIIVPKFETMQKIKILELPQYEPEALFRARTLSKLDQPRVFFRDDDVGKKTKTFVEFMNLIIEKQVPISLGVMPLAVDDSSVDYMIELQNKYPELVELDMHAYTHKQIGAETVGEFKNRERQIDVSAEIASGKGIMDQYFDEWSLIFTVPFSEWDNKLINSLVWTGFKGISGHYSGNVVDMSIKHNPDLLDYSTCLDIVDGWQGSEIKLISKEKFIQNYEQCKKGNSVGIMLHHEIHNKPKQVEFVKWMIDYIKADKEVIIIEMENLYLDNIKVFK